MKRSAKSNYLLLVLFLSIIFNARLAYSDAVQDERDRRADEQWQHHMQKQDEQNRERAKKIVDQEEASKNGGSEGFGLGGWLCLLLVPVVFVVIFVESYKKAKYGEQGKYVQPTETEIQKMLDAASGSRTTASHSPPTNKSKPPVRQTKSPRVEPFARPTPPRFLGQENGAIHFECGYCSQRIEIDAAGGGMEIKCPECGEPQKVPTS
jgi:hypothetical protein